MYQSALTWPRSCQTLSFPVFSHLPISLTSASSPNPAHKTMVLCDDETRPACAPEVHRLNVYTTPGDWRGWDVIRQTAISYPTNVPSIEVSISTSASTPRISI
ncbi:hypothetical protein PISMIDRAFT_321797 [Pisolithus microcarpus 441]|uniref:Uncharacterized protein n=1 Tax=Pisolithus microcarpus 441 TaxID=765257 RepID=A0A0C9Z6L0_9AGAM|nr:hypothetical protein BKA83DRAFT_321797 [Pisolithus microcarpus]KIK15518.1 hypothetical protein PISMIDRAFT_321797 [Pisolithus microcarpus 441]